MVDCACSAAQQQQSPILVDRGFGTAGQSELCVSVLSMLMLMMNCRIVRQAWCLKVGYGKHDMIIQEKLFICERAVSTPAAFDLSWTLRYTKDSAMYPCVEIEIFYVRALHRLPRAGAVCVCVPGA